MIYAVTAWAIGFQCSLSQETHTFIMLADIHV
jgi:hypothetical protein